MDSTFALLPLLLLVAVMIWMIISQRRRQREVAQMQAALAVGDEVLTVGGILGRLVAVDGPVIGLEVSDGVVLRVDRRTISGRVQDVPAFAAAHPEETLAARGQEGAGRQAGVDRTGDTTGSSPLSAPSDGTPGSPSEDGR